MTEFEKVVRSVPRRPATVWQVGVVRLPVWVRGEDGEVFRPEAALCIDVKEDLMEATEPEPAGAVAAAELVRRVLVRAVRSWVHVPDTLAIADPALSAGLRKELAGTGVSVAVEPELEALERVLTVMAEAFAEGRALPGILSGEGVTVGGVAAFARAARRFQEAAPWRFLSNEDLVRVEAPEMEAGLRDVVVMGEGGMQHGLMFFSSPGQFEAVERGEPGVREGMIEEGVWSVNLEDPEEALPADLDVWERHDLPTAGGLLPVPARLGRSLERPDARILAFFEGLLSALAESTEEEIDSGRWEKQVKTARGPLRFRLALPDLLEGGEPLSTSGKDSQELAADLLCEAQQEARGRRRILLARRALEICPEFAEAYEFLGDLAPDAESALDLYTRGLALAERELGPEVFEEHAGSFGDLFETQGYMGLRTSIAETLAKLNRPEEAVVHYEEMLRLDPGDSLGLVRYSLLDLLLKLERYEQAEELLLRYPEDTEIEWPYTRALLAFRREGEDSPETQRLLREALRRNRYVSDFLLEMKPLPEDLSIPPRPGNETEAALYAGAAMDLWESTPGALDWLDFWVPRLREAPKTGKKRAKRKTKKRRR
jgi:tetratricopeptide (TPR) repeat protein